MCTKKSIALKMLCVSVTLCMVLSLLPMASFAQAPAVAIDEKNFPDEIFRTYIQDFYDLDRDGSLSESESSCVTSLNLDKQGISSLVGIEHFPKLNTLQCYFNKLTTLDLSGNPALNKVNCSFNALTDLNVSNCAQLISLDCGDNNLTNLDLSGTPALQVLDCEINQLTSLDVSPLPSLTYLNCFINHLSSLDVSQNPALQTLACSINNISSLDVSHNPALEELECSELFLTELDVSHNPALNFLHCEFNNLTALDLSNNPALKALGCYHNPLGKLDVSHNTALTHLICDATKLTELDVSKNTALEFLSCSSNNLTSLDLSNNGALKDLYYEDNFCRVPESGTLDYTTLPGGFDVNRVTNVAGGKFDTSAKAFRFDSGAKLASYDYDTGNGTIASFKLVSDNIFADVSTEDYYHLPVLWAISRGVTSGMSENTFGPTSQCTRAQIVTFLWAAADKPEPASTENPFTDISADDYYYKAVLWAIENGITSGVAADRFGPDQVCTRAQAVTFLWAAVEKPMIRSGISFSDVVDSDYYYDAVQWAIKYGITAGVGGNRFGPSQNCTRAQIVTFMYKLIT